MLEDYFVRSQTVERIRSSWIGSAIEEYLARLEEQGYATQRLGQRVPILVRFGEFAQTQGAHSYAELPIYLNPFVEFWGKRRSYRHRVTPPRRSPADAVTRRIEAMLRVVVPGFVGHTRRRVSNEPFADRAPGFFTYLRQERGLRESTLGWYGNHLRQLDAYLIQRGIRDLASLSPDIISGFLTDRAQGLQPSYVRIRGTVLRMFLRYLHREGVVPRDLSPTVEAVPVYRLAKIPRAITVDEVNQMLSGVDRQTVIGRRDYAILLLLVTYGLRAREVAALTLDSLDWRHDRLRIPERKAGHSTVYPLSPVVGEAIIDYLKDGRPKTTSRHVFLHVTYPRGPITHVAVAHRAAHYLHKAGIAVPRAGSHTLRHTCVQRLVDAGWHLKQIGDYVGHSDPRSTEIYSKVALDKLREVALRRWRGDRMKSQWTGFRSPLGPGIEAFLAHRRALGCRLRTEEMALRLLDRFLLKENIASLDAITPVVIDAFLASRPRYQPQSYNHLLGTISRVFDWLAKRDLAPPSPVHATRRRGTRSRLPFLLDADAAQRLLQAAGNLPDVASTPLRPQVYRTIFALLYALGMRVGEVARLRVGDIDGARQLLEVRQQNSVRVDWSPLARGWAG